MDTVRPMNKFDHSVVKGSRCNQTGKILTQSRTLKDLIAGHVKSKALPVVDLRIVVDLATVVGLWTMTQIHTTGDSRSISQGTDRTLVTRVPTVAGPRCHLLVGPTRTIRKTSSPLVQHVRFELLHGCTSRATAKTTQTILAASSLLSRIRTMITSALHEDQISLPTGQKDTMVAAFPMTRIQTITSVLRKDQISSPTGQKDTMVMVAASIWAERTTGLRQQLDVRTRTGATLEAVTE